jgi:ankyrin repeat protein
VHGDLIKVYLYVGIYVCSQGVNALVRAAGFNSEAAVDYLLSIGANVNRQNTKVPVFSGTIGLS